ncbi:MAG: DUF418 domain-containing protein, partial [Acidobacteriota bacterium]
FGAGLVLMDSRSGERSIAGLWYRRLGWLVVIGAAHAYLLWFGDILFSYAVLGMAIYPLRAWSPRRLLAIGGVMMVIGLGLSSFGGFFAQKMRTEGPRLLAEQEAGATLGPRESGMLQQWKDMRVMTDPSAEDARRDVEIYRDGSFGEILAHRAPVSAMMQTAGLFFFGIWRMGALMLWGMALMKLGVFSAERSDAFYRRLALFGYGLGLPLLAVSSSLLASRRWDFVFLQIQGIHWNLVGSLGIALGHVAVVMLVWRSGAARALMARLEAVGQMALSNYLTHTLVFTLLFYSYGFGLYGRIERPAQMLLVLAMWALQLVISPWWLARFRFGPAEWLWRSLTYGERQPLSRPGTPIP